MPTLPVITMGQTESQDDGSTSLSRRAMMIALALIPGAGAAVGDELGESIWGVTTEVTQAVVLEDAEVHSIPIGIGNMDLDGHQFRTTAEIAQGDLYAIHLILNNQSDDTRSHRLHLDGMPDGLFVELFPDEPSGIEVQEVDELEWVLEIGPSEDSTLPDHEQVLELVLDTTNDFQTGFVTFGGRLTVGNLGGD